MTSPAYELVTAQPLYQLRDPTSSPPTWYIMYYVPDDLRPRFVFVIADKPGPADFITAIEADIARRAPAPPPQ